jgi:type II secretory pathway component PulF
MAEFVYKGIDQSGKSVRGVIQATDRREAVSALTARGHFATEIHSDNLSGTIKKSPSTSTVSDDSVSGRIRISGKDINAMTNQLSTALKAGLPILDALQILAQQQTNTDMKVMLQDLADAVRAGQSLSDAMQNYPDTFSKLYISMVQVGETGGILDQTMVQLAGLLNREQKIKATIKSALMYPAFVLALGITSVIVMLTVVFPKMMNVFGGTRTLLPMPTRILLGLSDFLLQYGWVVGIALIIGIYLFIQWRKTSAGRLAFDSFLLRMPVFGPVLKAIAVGRFTRTLGALAKSGINILPALAVVRDTLGNECLGEQIDHVAEKVKTGEPIASPLAESELFPPLLIQIVNMGEQTGTIDDMLLNAANTFDEEADTAINRFMEVFPVLLIVLLALVIGFIIFASLLPILTMDMGGMGA